MELRQLAEKLYKGEDTNFNKSMGPMVWMPTWLIRRVTKVVGYLTGILGIAVPALGLEVPKKDINDLFDSWDKDGGGALGLRELQKILSSSRVQSGGKKSSLQKEMKATGAVAAVTKMNAISKMGGGGS